MVALPFLFGGGLSCFLAISLHAVPARSGTPPYWVLFLVLGAIALVAGVLLLFAREEREEEEDDEESIAVPRKEWDRVQRELRRLSPKDADDQGSSGSHVAAGLAASSRDPSPGARPDAE